MMLAPKINYTGIALVLIESKLNDFPPPTNKGLKRLNPTNVVFLNRLMGDFDLGVYLYVYLRGTNFLEFRDYY